MPANDICGLVGFYFFAFRVFMFMVVILVSVLINNKWKIIHVGI